MATIALDAMGGDHGPSVVVAAARGAVATSGLEVILVGAEATIRPKLGAGFFGEARVRIVDAPETVSMEDAAVAAVRRNKRASIPVGLELLKSGEADAFVSAGNTGAVVASAVVSLGRLPGVSRPGIAIPIPTADARPALLIDAGAITDPRPEVLVQHALLASAYVTRVQGVERPRVGLISNGEESTKGNALVKAVYPMLEANESLSFIGNIESRSIAAGQCDVIVTDGFTGNIILKTAEGIASLFQETLRAEFRRRWHTALLAMLLKPAFRRAGRRLDYREYGGAPLLGVDGLVFIAHGRSDELALMRAIEAADAAATRNALEELKTATATLRA
jgi:phosphate acyltransferase